MKSKKNKKRKEGIYHCGLKLIIYIYDINGVGLEDDSITLRTRVLEYNTIIFLISTILPRIVSFHKVLGTTHSNGYNYKFCLLMLIRGHSFVFCFCFFFFY